MDIMRYVFIKTHDYLMLNVDQQKLYSNFDEIILKQDDDEE